MATRGTDMYLLILNIFMLPATPAMVALAINVAAAAVVVRLLMDRRLGMVVTEGMVFL